MEFAPDSEIQKIATWVDQFVTNVLFDEEPLFISDEATIWDLSMSTPEELVERCSRFYGRRVTVDDLRKPLFKLIRDLNENRT